MPDEQVRTFFKAGTEGGPPVEPDDRVSQWGSTLKARRSGQLKARPKPKKPSSSAEWWADARRVLRRRAGNKCEAASLGLGYGGCDPSFGMQAHHIIPKGNRYCGPDDVANLLWVCDRCHHHLANNGSGVARRLGMLAQVPWAKGDRLPWQGGRLVALDCEHDSFGRCDDCVALGEAA